MLSVWIISLGFIVTVSALDNGLGRTPPMGWLSWQRYRCLTDCVNFPDECISEQLLRRTADLMVSEGYLELGYEYIIIDDCWLVHERDSEGRLQADPDRFPNGMKALGDYIHSLGLKFGIYEDYGTSTCAGYPGLLGHLDIDAQTFADWGVDYIKVDGCNADPNDLNIGFPAFGNELNKTGRPIFYACNWPMYQQFNGIEPDFDLVEKSCNIWRDYSDISDSFEDVKNIMNFFADKQDTIVPHVGPGHFNDPDMLLIGNYGLSLDQSQTQMAVWSILAAPLLMSTELRDVRPEFKAILQNKAVLAVNQDVLGLQGKRIVSKDDIEVWTRPVSPNVGENYSYAVAIVSKRIDGYPQPTSNVLRDIGLTNADGYTFEDLYDPTTPSQVLKPDDALKVRVNPTGVKFYRATIIA